MVFIDVHCHLELLKDIEKVVERAKKKNVDIIVYNSINSETMRYALELSEKYREIRVALGIYPIDCLKLSNLEINKENFIKFLHLAKELDLPVFIHSRGAEEKVIEILENEKIEKVIMHCFCGNFKLVDRIIKNNWMLSIPTNITFSEHFQKIVDRVDIKNLFCETDSPFLHPEKGKMDNEPGNVIESYKMIAKIKQISLEECEKIIESNFNRLFNNF